jgi:flagellar biosynthetic protein FliR
LQAVWDLIVGNFIGVLIVFSRVTGIFTFNPILGRTNVPVTARIMMSLAIAAMLLYGMDGQITGYMPTSVLGFIWVLIKEMLLGMLFGVVVNMMLSALILAGEVVDNQIGLSLAKMFDPSSGIQMTVFANLFFYMFVLYFFITNGHLEYIRLFSLSYDIVPIGFELNIHTQELMYNLVMYMGTIFTLGLKLAMPVIATELIVEVCVGVMMKAVPTIQVFMVNIDLKIIVGLFILMAVATPISDYVDGLLGILWQDLDVTLHSVIGAG